MNLLDLYAKITLDSSEYEQGLERAGEQGDSFASRLKSGLTTAAKVGAAAITAASAAVGTLTKTSLDSYGQYEQLVGGVETLFKENANRVQTYAANAYKTAGMSANQYMETVTSFSASLLQSLGGDTEKAADVADRAITDMSDNANKMGTSMQSIQYAYQGFAKQNYTMLDNLKLGYGGTKEEMQRLLDDAGKLANQKFDLSSYADIVEAIHVVQTEMGITGTTASEAGSTIQGSAYSMKAAWDNLVTGMGDDTADLDTLINNFVENVGTAADNMLPRISKILSGMGDVIQKIAPVIAEQLPALMSEVLPSLLEAGAQLLIGIVQGVVTSAPQLIESIIGLIPSLVESFQENAPQLAEAGMALLDFIKNGVMEGLPMLGELAFEMLTNLGTYIQENLPVLLENVLPMIEQFTASLRENAGLMVDGALALLESLAQGLADSLPALIESVPTIISNIANIINDNAPKMLESALNILLTLGQGLIAAIPVLIENIPQIIQSIVDVIRAFDWINLGSSIIKGLGSGIKAMASGLKEFVSNGFSGAINFIKGLPGKAIQWGKDFIGGLIEGIVGSIGGVVDAVKGIGSKIASFLHFSRPDTGPLRDYETWMPDMMSGLAKGIRDNAHLIQDQLDKSLNFDLNIPQLSSGAAAGYGVSNSRFGNINITINAAPGQNVKELATLVADEINNTVIRGRATFA